MISRIAAWSAACVLALMCAGFGTSPAPEMLVTGGEAGTYGGRLVIAQRAEPKTLQPLFALDNPSREVIRLMTADLVHLNRLSQKTEPALAKSWTVSNDGRRFTLQLRQGLCFSDGHPMDADDVIFSFQLYLDEKLNSPQRDLLMIGGKPISFSKTGPYTIEFELAQPYAAAERLFDSIAILPRHLLKDVYREGKLPQTWGLATDPGRIAGMGPFRLRQYIPGDRIILERNPYYWKADRKGNRLPYIDEIVLLAAGSEDAQVIRFQSGETDVLSRVSAANFAVLEKNEKPGAYRLFDLGPGLEYEFLFFNLNDLSRRSLPQIAHKQSWFQQTAFRQAVSAAIDREALVRLAFEGRATPLWNHVTPGDRLWLNDKLPRPARSISEAKRLLASAGFHWKADGGLIDAAGEPVEFSIVTNAGNAPRMQMATMLQADLGEIGIQVHVVPLEFRSLLDRVLKSYDYEACMLSIAGGDADPNGNINVLLSSGGSHVWHPAQEHPATPWEAEIDRLMQQQLTTAGYLDRKRLYDRVQQLMAENLPLICLASPNILVGAREGLGNFKPANLEDYALWNIEELYWRAGQSGARP